jgi:elongation factor Ts
VEVMQITNEMIKHLREKTGAGMMDCKRALEQSGGNMEAAIEHLRKKGAAIGQKRSDRSAKEGAIVTRLSGDGKTGVIVEVNCETDFVGRSDDFLGFGRTVAETIERHKPSSVEALLSLQANNRKISELLNDLLAKVGERVDIRRFEVYETSNGVVSGYTHLGNKIGVLVELSRSTGDATVIGRDVAMQVAAMNPMVVSRDQIAKEVVERELDIYRTQAKNEGKAQQVIEKIVAGKLEKFYQEVCLLEQTFIKDSGRTIKEYLQDAGGATGENLTVKRFDRFHLGEETP